MDGMLTLVGRDAGNSSGCGPVEVGFGVVLGDEAEVAALPEDGLAELEVFDDELVEAGSAAAEDGCADEAAEDGDDEDAADEAGADEMSGALEGPAWTEDDSGSMVPAAAAVGCGGPGRLEQAATTISTTPSTASRPATLAARRPRTERGRPVRETFLTMGNQAPEGPEPVDSAGRCRPA